MRCPACSDRDLEPFFRQRAVPVLCNVLLESAEAARQAPVGEIVLGVCPGCGMIFNTAFDPEAIGYDQAYENSLHFSPRFHAWAQGLAAGLVERHGLRDKTVVDIGCGKGDFLRLICEAGPCTGIGFDTSWEGGDGPQRAGAGSFRVVPEFYDESHGDLTVDLICCRHVLEHVPAPVEFLDGLRKAASANSSAGVYFEVPNALWTLRDLGIWDIIYEHCAYYSDVSLSALFRARGFGNVATRTEFGEQYLCLDADLNGGEAVAPDPRALAELVRLAREFGSHHREKVAQWDDRLDDWRRSGRRVAIWGAGSKGVTFLNTVAGGDGVVCAVDINARKHGRYVPGSGQEVVDPSALADLRVDTVLIMNGLYRDEIASTLAGLGLNTGVEVV